MTIVAGFPYADGVLLCADSQFTVGPAKIDGLKIGSFDASWGTVVCGFAGNVHYAASAFQHCERKAESDDARESPLTYLETVLEEFYRRQVFGHPTFQDGHLDYALFLAVHLKGQGLTRMYRTYETVFREVKSFDGGGTGEGSARELLRSLYRAKMSRSHAVALASYMLAHVKLHAQYCGGNSVVVALDHRGHVETFDSAEFEQLALHIENVSGWFVNESQQFMLGHTSGDMREFKKRLLVLRSRALHMRKLWDDGISARRGIQSPAPERIDLPPWPELPEESGES